MSKEQKEELIAKREEQKNQIFKDNNFEFKPNLSYHEYLEKNPEIKERVLSKRSGQSFIIKKDGNKTLPSEGWFVELNCKSRDDWDKYYEEMEQKKIEFETSEVKQTPTLSKYIRMKHKDEKSLKKVNGKVDLNDRSIWKYSTSFREKEYEPEVMDAYEFKLKNNKYDFFIKINESTSKRHFIQDVKKDTDLEEMRETKKEKLKELTEKWYGPKSPSFQCHFWPQFGKRL